jgi:hypothetical protein
MQVFLIIFLSLFLLTQITRFSKGFLEGTTGAKGWLYRTGLNASISLLLAFPVKFIYLIFIF